MDPLGWGIKLNTFSHEHGNFYVFSLNKGFFDFRVSENLQPSRSFQKNLVSVT